MLMQILTHTPPFVWAILALLIWRGVAASKTRDIGLRQAFILPVLMPVLSLQGVISAFGGSALAPLCWLAGVVLAALVRWRMGSDIVADPVRGAVRLPGSWMPLVLMMGIFVTKYAVAVALAVHPVFRLDTAFVAAICLLYGVFSGLFFGNLLRIIAAYRRAQAGLALPVAVTAASE